MTLAKRSTFLTCDVFFSYRALLVTRNCQLLPEKWDPGPWKPLLGGTWDLMELRYGQSVIHGEITEMDSNLIFWSDGEIRTLVQMPKRWVLS